MDIFLFCFAVAINLIERLEIAFFSCIQLQVQIKVSFFTISSIQNQIVEIVLQTVYLIDPAEM